MTSGPWTGHGASVTRSDASRTRTYPTGGDYFLHRPAHLTRDGIDNADDDHDGYGDPSRNAEAQALRRAAMAHGLGRALWRR